RRRLQRRKGDLAKMTDRERQEIKMTDENANTADLTMDEKLDRILSELREVKARLSAIEEKVVGRTNETQMKLDKIIQEIFDNERLEKIRTGGPQPRAIQYGSRSGGGGE